MLEIIAQSFYVKADGRNFVAISNNSNGGSVLRCEFDLTTGTITWNGFGNTPTIEALADSWYKITGVNVSTTAGFGRNFSLEMSNVSVLSNTAVAYTGDGTSGIYIYGAQLEEGSYSTSYIVSNSGSATTRIAEVCNNSGNASTFNDSEGVLMAQISALADSTFKYITISDGSIQNRITIILLSNNNIYGQVRAANSEVFFQETSGISIQHNNKIAVSYKTNQCKLFVNGFQVGSTDTSVSMPSGLNTLAFDDGTGAGDFYGKTKQIAYFPEALTDSELECLTSWSSFNRMAIDLNYTIQ